VETWRARDWAAQRGAVSVAWRQAAAPRAAMRGQGKRDE
jgi:hypothetical protein